MRIPALNHASRHESTASTVVDLIVIEAEPFEVGRSRHDEMVRLDQALADFRVLSDVLVFSRDEMEYWRDSINHVLARALREGKLLYERP